MIKMINKTFVEHRSIETYESFKKNDVTHERVLTSIIDVTYCFKKSQTLMQFPNLYRANILILVLLIRK